MSTKKGIVDEIHRAARRNFPRRYVTIKGLYDLYQADLVEMIPYSKENGGYKYMLTMIDTFSKRGWAMPLKTKRGKEVAEVLGDTLRKLKRPMKYLQTDLGKEFYNVHVSRLLAKYNIKHYSSFSHLKASIIERFNRTLKSWMWKMFSLRGSHEWLTILEQLLKKYNNRVHRTIGLAPSSVNEKNEKTVLARLMRKKLADRKNPKYRIGDPVRISKFKHQFEKGYTPNWTTEVFFVHKVQRTLPVTYQLKDINDEIVRGGFYEQELLKTKYKDIYLVEKVLKRKGDKVLVKWLGFDKRHNQWIKASDIQK